MQIISFRVETLLSSGNALNFAQAYRGFFSFVQSTHWMLADLELAVKEATALPGPVGRLGGGRGLILDNIPSGRDRRL